MIIIKASTRPNPLAVEHVVDMFGDGPRGVVARMILHEEPIQKIMAVVKERFPGQFESDRLSSTMAMIAEVKDAINEMINNPARLEEIGARVGLPAASLGLAPTRSPAAAPL